MVCPQRRLLSWLQPQRYWNATADVTNASHKLGFKHSMLWWFCHHFPPSNKGVCYIRTSRLDNSIIYNSNEDFHVGQAKVRGLYNAKIKIRRRLKEKLHFKTRTILNDSEDAVVFVRWCIRARRTRWRWLQLEWPCMRPLLQLNIWKKVTYLKYLKTNHFC